MLSFFASALPCLALMVPVDCAFPFQRALPADPDINSNYDSFEQVGPSLFGPTRVSPANETLFGSSVALSEDGLHLAIGARGYDASSSSIGSGGVFLYHYDSSTSTWSSTIVIDGNPGESIGYFIALSGDGSRVAIRRSPGSTPNFVEIFDTSSGLRLGPSLGCGVASGSTVAISHGGDRVAVSCEQKTVNKGSVGIFDWNGTDWGPLASIDGAAIGISNQGLFGWATSFSKSGNRLAVSAPLFSSGGSNPMNRRGLVRVFDYKSSSSSWEQVGNDLLGVGTQNRFGLAIDLSGDGSTLLVGNSRLGTNSSGLVEIFQYESGSWAVKGSAVEGSEESDAFGVSLSSSFDGNAFVASSAVHNNERGQVRLMKFNGTDWNQIVSDIEGLQEGDRFGDGRNVVSLSGDGLRLASGSQFATSNGNPTGRVRVFDLAVSPPSSTPSAVPPAATSTVPSVITSGKNTSLFPSSEPSFSPSSLPSLSPIPSHVASTIYPTVTLDKFSWDIERADEATILFDESFETREISLSYNISLRPAVVTILDENCTTAVGQDIVGVEKELNITSATHGNLDVFLDIKQVTIQESLLWQDGADTTEGHVNMCVRVDLQLSDGTSVHFHEQKLYITIGLSAGFQVSQIDLDREDAAEAMEEIDATYEVESCQCDDEYVCRDDTLVQGEDVLICVFTNATNIELSAIEKLDFIQGPLSIAAVSNRLPDALTSVLLLGKLAVIRTQLRSVFFDESNPQIVIADGISSITFVNGTSANRRLRINHSRKIQSIPEGENANFDVRMALAPYENDDNKTGEDSDPKNTGLIAGITLGALTVVVLVVGAVFLKKKDNQDEEDGESPLENPVL